ncbi:hypothetical protein T492DRAFT_476540 [Pavlovales sp. CCMP2436]|nr:hypothetical protein T492DRAFT_476540 [Pavlovales sp. CCMP2436]
MMIITRTVYNQQVHPPLAAWIATLAAQGAHTASALYSCEGGCGSGGECAAEGGAAAGGDGKEGSLGGANGRGGRRAGAGEKSGLPASTPPWVAHGFTDRWGNGTPLGETVWSLCAACGGWLALALWEHFRYTQQRCVRPTHCWQAPRADFSADWSAARRSTVDL